MKSFLLTACFALLGFLSYAQQADSLWQVARDAQQADTTRVQAYLNLSQWYLRHNLDSAYLLADQAQRLARETQDPAHLGQAYIRKGVVFWYQSHYDSGLVYLQKAQEIFTSLQDRESLLHVWNDMGLVYAGQGQNEKAMQLYLKALHAEEATQNDAMQASLLYNVAILYDTQQQTKEALPYYRKALALARQQLSRAKQLTYLKGLGNAFFTLKQYDSARHYLYASVALAQQMGQKVTLADVYQSLGSLHLDLGQLDSALYYYQHSKALNLETHDRYLLSYNYQGLSAYYQHHYQQSGNPEDLKQVQHYGGKLIELAKEMGDAERLMQGYDKVGAAAKDLGDYQAAYQNLLQYGQLRDSIFKKDQSDQLLKMKTLYETEKKEQQIALQQADLQRQANQRNFLIAGIVLLLLIAGLIYRSERLKSRKNRQIESLLKEIHHRVKNNLQVISSLLNMQSRKVDDEATLGAIQEGRNRVKAMSLIHEKLYQTNNVTSIDFREYAQELLQQLSAVFNPAERKIEAEVNGPIKLDIDTAIPLGLILNELISNAYKYAFEGRATGKIQVDLERISEQELTLKVKDDGVGLPSDFKPQNAKSLGLKLVNILTKQLKGSWEYRLENGTEFFITFKEVTPGV